VDGNDVNDVNATNGVIEGGHGIIEDVNLSTSKPPIELRACQLVVLSLTTCEERVFKATRTLF
jgi:hypothetical protein